MNYRYNRYYADSLASGIENLKKEAFLKKIKALHNISKTIKSAERTMPLGSGIREVAQKNLKGGQQTLLDMSKENLKGGGMFSGLRQKRIDKLLSRGEKANRLKVGGGVVPLGSPKPKPIKLPTNEMTAAAAIKKPAVKKKTSMRTIKNYGLIGAGTGGLGYLAGTSGRPSPGNNKYY